MICHFSIILSPFCFLLIEFHCTCYISYKISPDYVYYYCGWCEGGLRQRRNDCGGCATMCKRPERVESPGTYVIE